MDSKDVKKVNLHPAYWRAVSDFYYAVVCMSVLCGDNDMCKDIFSLQKSLDEIHKAYNVDIPKLK